MPREDIMTLLTQAEEEVDGERHRLTDLEISSFFNLLATAGNETVTKLLATAYYWLGVFPDQRRLLVDDPSLCSGAVEETLRFDPPSQYQGRVLKKPVKVHGRTIPAGGRLQTKALGFNFDFRMSRLYRTAWQLAQPRLRNAVRPTKLPRVDLTSDTAVFACMK